MLARIHVAIFLRTATKNKKLLAGGIQSESSRSNCDVANLVTTAKKTQCDGWKYQKALDRNWFRNLRLELRKTNIAGWRNDIRIQKRKPRSKCCRKFS